MLVFLGVDTSCSHSFLKVYQKKNQGSFAVMSQIGWRLCFPLSPEKVFQEFWIVSFDWLNILCLQTSGIIVFQKNNRDGAVLIWNHSFYLKQCSSSLFGELSMLCAVLLSGDLQQGKRMGKGKRVVAKMWKRPAVCDLRKMSGKIYKVQIGRIIWLVLVLKYKLCLGGWFFFLF